MISHVESVSVLGLGLPRTQVARLIKVIVFLGTRILLGTPSCASTSTR